MALTDTQIANKRSADQLKRAQKNRHILNQWDTVKAGNPKKFGTWSDEKGFKFVQGLISKEYDRQNRPKYQAQVTRIQKQLGITPTDPAIDSKRRAPAPVVDPNDPNHDWLRLQQAQQAQQAQQVQQALPPQQTQQPGWMGRHQIHGQTPPFAGMQPEAQPSTWPDRYQIHGQTPPFASTQPEAQTGQGLNPAQAIDAVTRQIQSNGQPIQQPTAVGQGQPIQQSLAADDNVTALGMTPRPNIADKLRTDTDYQSRLLQSKIDQSALMLSEADIKKLEDAGRWEEASHARKIQAGAKQRTDERIAEGESIKANEEADEIDRLIDEQAKRWGSYNPDAPWRRQYRAALEAGLAERKKTETLTYPGSSGDTPQYRATRSVDLMNKRGPQEPGTIVHNGFAYIAANGQKLYFPYNLKVRETPEQFPTEEQKAADQRSGLERQLKFYEDILAKIDRGEVRHQSLGPNPRVDVGAIATQADLDKDRADLRAAQNLGMTMVEYRRMKLGMTAGGDPQADQDAIRERVGESRKNITLLQKEIDSVVKAFEAHAPIDAGRLTGLYHDINYWKEHIDEDNKKLFESLLGKLRKKKGLLDQINESGQQEQGPTTAREARSTVPNVSDQSAFAREPSKEYGRKTFTGFRDGPKDSALPQGDPEKEGEMPGVSQRRREAEKVELTGLWKNPTVDQIHEFTAKYGPSLVVEIIDTEIAELEKTLTDNPKPPKRGRSRTTDADKQVLSLRKESTNRIETLKTTRKRISYQIKDTGKAQSALARRPDTA